MTEHPTAANNGWGRLPDGGGGRVHGKGSVQAKAFAGATAAGARAGYVYLHSAVDDDSRLAYTEPSTTKTQSLQSDSYTALACGSPPRRNSFGDPEVALEVGEPPDAVERVAHDEQRPAFADDLQRPGDRAVLVGVVTR